MNKNKTTKRRNDAWIQQNTHGIRKRTTWNMHHLSVVIRLGKQTNCVKPNPPFVFTKTISGVVDVIWQKHSKRIVRFACAKWKPNSETHSHVVIRFTDRVWPNGRKRVKTPPVHCVAPFMHTTKKHRTKKNYHCFLMKKHRFFRVTQFFRWRIFVTYNTFGWSTINHTFLSILQWIKNSVCFFLFT